MHPRASPTEQSIQSPRLHNGQLPPSTLPHSADAQLPSAVAAKWSAVLEDPESSSSELRDSLSSVIELARRLPPSGATYNAISLSEAIRRELDGAAAPRSADNASSHKHLCRSLAATLRQLPAADQAAKIQSQPLSPQ